MDVRVVLPKKEDALMAFPYRPDMVEQAGIHFDEVVNCILGKQFAINQPPEWKVCKECDLRPYCTNEKDVSRYGNEKRYE